MPSRGAGMRAFLLIFFALLNGTTFAKAEYRLRLNEVDETGAQVAEASWTCPNVRWSDGDLGGCYHQVEMRLGGKIQQVEVGFIVENSRAVALSLNAENNVVSAYRKDPLFVSKNDGIVGGSYELLMNSRKVKSDPLITDLTFRPAYDLPESIGLVVETITASTSK
jgi:hypothetical protein